MPMPLSIYETSGITITTTLKPSIDHHTTFTVNQLLGTSPVHTSAAIYRKLEPSIRQSPLEISFYKMSAADMIRHHYNNTGHELHQTTPQLVIEDQHSLSSVSYDSTNSSVSDATGLPTMVTSSSSSLCKTKKQSHRRLLREIRRLRSENANLHNSVNILKEDLRHERESRQIAEQCHKKYFDDSINTHTQLELEIMDHQDQIKKLKSQLGTTTVNLNTSITSYKSPLVDEDDDDDDLWNCEDMDCSIERRCYQDTDTNGPFSIYQDLQDSDEYDDEYDNSECNGTHEQDDQFENLAVSYLQQALVANLTSARANLEFDDLTLKYDPSPDRVLRTLADAFLVWLRDTIHTITNNDDNDKATYVARLISTQVQDVFAHFWKAILERYVHNDEDQYQFLHQFERILLIGHQGETCQVSQYIVQNFHRLLVMFYKYDIVGGDAVITWWHTLPGSLSSSLDPSQEFDNTDNDHDIVADQIRDVTKKFVEWVDDDDDDNDDDNDDDDDDQSLVFGNSDNDIDDDDDDLEYDSDLDINDDHLDGFDTTDLLATTPSGRSSIYPDKKKKSVTILV
ncbi:hypothetical protein BC941DRAFT_519066 [Chlamydoabsidia padenii]|nr:hypothetical protein BC941DRAFT_519066 [Chlamydoabsidia padenii]